jgi:hypothetical protein
MQQRSRQKTINSRAATKRYNDEQKSAIVSAGDAPVAPAQDRERPKVIASIQEREPW